jgi:hypothetical protein
MAVFVPQSWRQRRRVQHHRDFDSVQSLELHARRLPGIHRFIVLPSLILYWRRSSGVVQPITAPGAKGHDM